MKRFVEGEDRLQGALLPHCLDDYVTENNPVRVIEAFIDELGDTGLRGCSPRDHRAPQRNRGFESTSLQARVCCEPARSDARLELGRTAPEKIDHDIRGQASIADRPTDAL